jgi:hypothetical protein
LYFKKQAAKKENRQSITFLSRTRLLSTDIFLSLKRPELSWICRQWFRLLSACTRDQAFQHVAVQRVCAAYNIRILDDVTLMRELRHAASQ